MSFICSFCFLGQSRIHLYDMLISFGRMRDKTVTAVLDAVIEIAEISAASFPKSIERAVAEKTVEMIRICITVTWIIFTGFVAEILGRVFRHHSFSHSGIETTSPVS